MVIKRILQNADFYDGDDKYDLFFFAGYVTKWLQ